MTVKTRRILLIFFIIAFLIITPLVIFYANGYKFSLSGKIIQKTGMLILDSEPGGAKIYINGKPQQLFFKKVFNEKESFITTPAKIKNLKAGEYNIRLELDGFWGWEKKLEIKSGLSTFAEDINLFKKNLPLLLLDGAWRETSVSPNKKYLITVDNKKINLVNLETEEKKSTKPDFDINFDDLTKNSILWSPNSEKIIINSNILAANSLKLLVNLNEHIKAENIKWKEGSDNEIYYLSKNDKETSINRFNLITKIEKNIISEENITDFLIKNDQLFIIEKNGDASNLNIYEMDSSEIAKNIELPPVSDYIFINAENNLINLFDKKHKKLYLIDSLSYSPLEEAINDVSYTYWIEENKLLYANDFEIWMLDLNSRQKTLLTRISENITRILWHPSKNYVIYSTENTINIIELDDREKRNITELIKLDKISSPYLNKDGDAIYFNAKIGNQEGTYKLTIQ